MTPFRRLEVLFTSVIFSLFINSPTFASNSENSIPSIWPVISSGFNLDHEIHEPRVQYFIRYDMAHKNLIEAVLNNSKPVLYFISQSLKARHLPMELALLPAVESGYRLNIQSSAGAMGLWQLLPQIDQDYGFEIDSYWYDERQDMQMSTLAALNLLTQLYNNFNHNWLLAIAAYNSGPSAVKNSMARNLSTHHSTDFFALNLPSQTQDYVPKLLALSEIVAHPEKYGFTLPNIPNQELTHKVLVTQQINLSTAAAFSGSNIETLDNLNSDLLYGITPNQGPSYLYIPSEDTQHFEFELKHHTYAQYWNLYQVEPGEFLSTIAKNHQISVSELAKINNLSSLILQPHQTLITPASNGRIRQTSILKPNETLADFARRNKTTPSTLIMLNGLDPLEPLPSGTSLIID